MTAPTETRGDGPPKALTLSSLRRAVPIHRGMRARYDAAATTDENRRHWANADQLSADAANSPAVRAILRSRARYEVANNSYAKGMVRTLANDAIGTGPRLQMLTDDAVLNGEIEEDFEEWAAAVGLADKLQTMRMALAQDGEAFMVLSNNPFLDSPIMLDLRLIEADQVMTPLGQLDDANIVDGIAFDRFDNPVSYKVAKAHPGGVAWNGVEQFDTIPAESMIHLFRAERPGQHRGVPEIMPALPLFAQLRRYTLATLTAAESAADFAGILYSDQPPNEDEETVDPMDSFPLERGMLLTMPQGWKVGQVEATQPTTTYAEFKKEILNEIARCLNMPFNVVAGNSSGYNYASGRLDHQTYFKAIRVDQAFIARRVIDRFLRPWLAEHCIMRGRDLPSRMPRHMWFWDGTEHVDPVKEASAQETRLRNHTTTIAVECARDGRDWEEVLEQAAREYKRMKELGLPVASVPTAPADGQDDASDESQKDGEEE